MFQQFESVRLCIYSGEWMMPASTSRGAVEFPAGAPGSPVLHGRNRTRATAAERRPLMSMSASFEVFPRSREPYRRRAWVPLCSFCGRVCSVYKGGMTHLMLPCFRAFPIALALVGGASCWSTASFAQSTPVPTTTQPAPSTTTDTIRLTDEQRAKILDGITEDSAAAARGERSGSGITGQGIHGEVGAMIGSNGTRGVYGTADIPLGDNAGATVSFESSRFGYPR